MIKTASYSIAYIIQDMNKPISSPTQSTPKINQFNYHSHPTKALSDVLNSDFRILSFEISEHGRTGVFFIETSEGSFVMKSSNQGPKDEFLNRLAGMLSLSVPQSICYCCSEPIFHKLMFQIERYCQKDQMLYARIKTKLDFPFYQVLEYIPSVSLAEIGQERFQTHLLDQNKLYTLGMCLGFDIIVNNSDRFALLWSSDGNINNVLVQIEDHDTHQMRWIKDRSNTSVGLGNFVFIDHSGYLLDLKNPLAAKNFDNYMVRVADFLVKLIRAISQQKELPSKQFQKLKKQIALYSHYVLTDFDLRTISHGIIYIIKKFLQLFESKAIEQLYSNLKKQHKKQKKGDQESSYWYSYWNTELSRVNIFFLQEVYTKIAAIFTTYPETIEKIIEDVGDIDEQVGNTNFNDMNEILDVKASMAGRKPQKEEESQPPSKLDIPSENSVQPPPKSEEPDKLSEHKEDPIKEVEEQQEQSQLPKEEFNQQRPATPPKVRKWREKLNKFRQMNQKQVP